MQLRTLILSLAITASALPLASVNSGEGDVKSVDIARRVNNVRDTEGEVQAPQSVDIARRMNIARDTEGEVQSPQSVDIARRDDDSEVQSVDIARRDTEGEVQSVDIARRGNTARAEQSEPDSVDIA